MLFDLFRMKILVDPFLHRETHALMILDCPRLAPRDSRAVLLYFLHLQPMMSRVQEIRRVPAEHLARHSYRRGVLSLAQRDVE